MTWTEHLELVEEAMVIYTRNPCVEMPESLTDALCMGEQFIGETWELQDLPLNS